MGWWIGAAQAGHEFEVREAISALGATAWVARQVEARRAPTRRRPIAVTTPYLGRYVFIECDDDTWHRVHGVKHLGATMMPVGPLAARRDLLPFMARVDADYADRMARHEAGEKLEAYQPGDLLVILAGPLAEQIVRFERIVEGASEIGDRLAARLDLMGRGVAVTLDPLRVRKMAAE